MSVTTNVWYRAARPDGYNWKDWVLTSDENNFFTFHECGSVLASNSYICFLNKGDIEKNDDKFTHSKPFLTSVVVKKGGQEFGLYYSIEGNALKCKEKEYLSRHDSIIVNPLKNNHIEFWFENQKGEMYKFNWTNENYKRVLRLSKNNYDTEINLTRF